MTEQWVEQKPEAPNSDNFVSFTAERFLSDHYNSLSSFFIQCEHRAVAVGIVLSYLLHFNFVITNYCLQISRTSLYVRTNRQILFSSATLSSSTLVQFKNISEFKLSFFPHTIFIKISYNSPGLDW